jgi:hypothetical protein
MEMARPGGLELPTFWFVARRSIQLSYGRAVDKYYHRLALRIQPPRQLFFLCVQTARQDTRQLQWTGETGSSVGFARRLLCATHETSAMGFGAAPE